MHYYQFNIGDYASHTKGLSLIEDLAYRRMIDEYYLSEQPLNGCSTDVARCCGLLEHVEEVEYVLSRFFVKEGDLWQHKRIDIEIKAYKTGRSAKSKAGKASAKARKLKASEQVLDSVSTGVEQPLKSVEQTKNHKPLTNNHIEEIPDSDKSEPKASPVKTKSKRNKPKTPINDSFTVTSKMLAWVQEKDYGHINLIEQTDRFIDHWKAKGESRADWIASWRTWIRNADKFQKQDSSRGNQRQQVADAIGGDSSFF